MEAAARSRMDDERAVLAAGERVGGRSEAKATCLSLSAGSTLASAACDLPPPPAAAAAAPPAGTAGVPPVAIPSPVGPLRFLVRRARWSA
eukprot:5803776-Pyramimonas_sp.AAC.1